MTRALKVIRGLFIVFLLFAMAFFLFIYMIFAPCLKPGASRVFTVKPGESAREIARRLRSEGLIHSALAFRLLVRLARGETRIKAGDYEITSRTNSLALLEKLVRGNVLRRLITVPEGSRNSDIAKMLGDLNIVSPEEFLELAGNNKTLRVADSIPANLEGYLFPDTYEISPRASSSDIAGMMVARFNEIVVPEFLAHAVKGKLVLERIVTIASLVEKEARLERERPLIAGVYFNRLELGMPLQCDATIQYALGCSKPVLTYADLKVESPYNTYLHSGIPPGPICNPGLQSIRAALSPAKVKYLYYVVDEIRDDGSHLFSITFEEHRRALDKGRKKTE